MRNAANAPVLVLNQSFEPVSICHLRRAIKLLVKDSAFILEHMNREVHAGMMWPTVIRLKHYKRIPHRVQVLTRKNIFMRDGHQCQYCGERFPAMVLTLDHVMPRSRGGRSTWENLVACCRDCNKRKADRTPEEAEMPLLRRPRQVTIHTARGILRSHGEHDAQWKKYLYYDNEGETASVTRMPS